MGTALLTMESLNACKSDTATVTIIRKFLPKLALAVNLSLLLISQNWSTHAYMYGSCHKNWFGVDCSIHICDKPESDPCNKVGKCIPDGDNFLCVCLTGYTGEFCQFTATGSTYTIIIMHNITTMVVPGILFNHILILLCPILCPMHLSIYQFIPNCTQIIALGLVLIVLISYMARAN